METQRRVLGAEHPETLRTAYNLTDDLAGVGRVGEAVVLGEETLEARRRVLGAEHPETLDTAYNLAVWLAGVGRAEEAVVLEEETLETQRRVLGLEHPDALSTAHNLAVHLWDAGRVEEARVRWVRRRWSIGGGCWLRITLRPAVLPPGGEVREGSGRARSG